MALRHRDITLERLEKFLSPIYWTDINLHAPQFKHKSSDCVEFSVYSVPDLGRVSYAEAVDQDYTSVTTGHSIGPSWSTHWFRVNVTIPEDWAGEEVELLWDSGCEALVWEDGEAMQGLNGGGGDDRRVLYSLTQSAEAGQCRQLYIEASCNGLFGVGGGGMIQPPDPDRRFTVETVQCVVRRSADAGKLLHDMQLILEMARELPADSVRGSRALHVANAAVNAFRAQDESSWQQALSLTTSFLSVGCGPGAHAVTAVGHCHIDTAWLWPYDETKRKIARSWSTALRLMRRYPEYRFCASQAQQYDWLRRLYPRLFRRVAAAVAAGRFLPVGGSWVEMDANIPSGESMVRQFLKGQAFFQQHFGQRCSEFWLPDTFGYSPQLPQLMRGAGMPFFLSQKLSWNLINKFPHTTFVWEGLDGSQVLAHFPPAETYNSRVEVKELLKTQSNCRDKDRTNRSLLLFGWGDGGGGPDEQMLERLSRVRDCSGLPTVTMGSPLSFFQAALADTIPSSPAATATAATAAAAAVDCGSDSVAAAAAAAESKAESASPAAAAVTAPTATAAGVVAAAGGAAAAAAAAVDNSPALWVGELYFELHQGTFTSQAACKRGNRRAQRLLHNVEVLSSIALIATVAAADSKGDNEGDSEGAAAWAYPARPLSLLWEWALLCQFHDVLPGSSIAQVHRDTERYYANLQTVGRALLHSATRAATAAASTAAAAAAAATTSRQPLPLVAPVPAPLPFPQLPSAPLPAALCGEGADGSSLGLNEAGETGMAAPDHSSLLAAVAAAQAEADAAAAAAAASQGSNSSSSSSSGSSSSGSGGLMVWNTLGFPRTGEVVEVPATAAAAASATASEGEGKAEATAAAAALGGTQPSASGGTLTFAAAPAMGCRLLPTAATAGEGLGLGVAAVVGEAVTASDGSDGYLLRNGLLRVRIRGDGTLSSVLDTRQQPPREVLAPFHAPLHRGDGSKLGGSGGGDQQQQQRRCVGNALCLFDDVPFFWDAWDTMPYHLQTRRPLPPASRCRLLETGPLRATVAVEWARVGQRSSVTQTISLCAGSARIQFDTLVDWRESHTLLKVEFPLALRSDRCWYETQFGQHSRPSHANTSWDMAQYEVVAQRYADLCEPGYGCALLNDSKHGYSCRGNTLSLSLLRSPKAPDRDCDMGWHSFTYALYPHAGDSCEGRVAQQAATLCQPLHLWTTAAAPPSATATAAAAMATETSFFGVVSSTPAAADNSSTAPPRCSLLLDTVKRAEDGRGLILRLYEAYGRRGTALLTSGAPRRPRAAELCNLLEDCTATLPLIPPPAAASAAASTAALVALQYTPYQVLTVRLVW